MASRSFWGGGGNWGIAAENETMKKRCSRVLACVCVDRVHGFLRLSRPEACCRPTVLGTLLFAEHSNEPTVFPCVTAFDR